MFENRGLKRMFEPKMEKVTGVTGKCMMKILYSL
jgi:hypothetical protein